MEIRVGFPEDQRAVAAALYDEAFKRKLAPMIPDDGQRRAVLADCLDPQRGVVAVLDGQLVGLAGFHYDERSFTGAGGWGTLFEHLGLWGTLRAAVGFALFERTPEPDELLMDGICVAAEARGQGLGTRLLRALCDHGRELGLARVRLDVIDTNPGARRLYEREGFVAGETVRVGWMRDIFGFSASTTMTKAL